MNAKYFARGFKTACFSKQSPCVVISMQEKEIEKFEKMMEWIGNNVCDYTYSLIQTSDDRITACIDVDHKYDAQWFLHDYKDAKKAIR